MPQVGFTIQYTSTKIGVHYNFCFMSSVVKQNTCKEVFQQHVSGGGQGKRKVGEEEEVGEGEKLERKGLREKEEIILRVLRGEDGDKGLGGGRSFPLVHPLMNDEVSSVCMFFMRMLTLYNVVKF